MKKREVKTANACYTGGGIYLLSGELSDGLFFMTTNDAEDVAIYDVDPYSADENDFLTYDWHEAHVVQDLPDSDGAAKHIVRDAVEWIADHRPDGNYIAEEVRRSFQKW